MDIPESLKNSRQETKDRYRRNGALSQPCGFLHKLLLVWKISLNLLFWLLHKYYLHALVPYSIIA